MSKSYQQENPPARVNITLDVDTGGSNSKKELPMKLLVLADFSNGQATGSIAKRERISVNKHNINQVLAALAPKASISVTDKLQNGNNELPVHLEFQSLTDFKPENIVQKIPQLQRLMAMRNLLKDLRSSVIDNHSFRKQLEAVVNDPTQARTLLNELSKTPSLENE